MSKRGVNALPQDASDGMISCMLMNNFDETVLLEISSILEIDSEINPVVAISEYMSFLSSLIQEYSNEIDKRKKFAIDKKIWEENEEKKPEETYPSDQYILMYILLCDNGIDPLKLNMYETMIIYEDIMVAKINEGSQSMLSMLSDNKYKGFVSTMKDYLKHANFVDFALDIYNEIEKMYESSIKDSKNK